MCGRDGAGGRVLGFRVSIIKMVLRMHVADSRMWTKHVPDNVE